MIVAGTGHRPDKLGGYGNEVRNRLVSVARDWLESEEVEKVISGGALGWDQALAEAAQELTLPVTMAIPFRGFEARWPQTSVQFLHSLCNKAKEVVYICEEGYAPWKMQVRNVWMVDNCDVVLALWNGTSGGTANCVAYAEKVGKPIINLWEKYNEHQ